MSRDITVIPFRQPDAVDDPLSEVAREGARRMLAQVLIAEADAFVAQAVFNCRIWRFVHLTIRPFRSRWPDGITKFRSPVAPNYRKLPDSISSGSGIRRVRRYRLQLRRPPTGGSVSPGTNRTRHRHHRLHKLARWVSCGGRGHFRLTLNGTRITEFRAAAETELQCRRSPGPQKYLFPRHKAQISTMTLRLSETAARIL